MLRAMFGVPRLIETSRLWLLLLTAPYTALWVRWGEAASGSWLMAAAHALLIVLAAAAFDLSTISRGEDPRLALRRDRRLWRREGLVATRTVLALPLMLCLAALSIFHPTHGLVAVVAAGVLLGASALAGSRQPRPDEELGGLRLAVSRAGAWLRRVRFAGAELLLPMALLLVPAVVIRLWSAGRPAGVAEAVGKVVSEMEQATSLAQAAGVLPATLLGSIVLGVFVLLCLVRDETADRAAGLKTVAVALGRAAATAYVFVFLLGAVLLSAWGVGVTHWHWAVAATVAAASSAVVYLLAARMDGYAVGAWLAGGAAVALMLLATTR
ncbi:MAG: hypothetical protein IBJ11_03745 [Phycisphaerales bacterium]|nr:hypothetical protein [Phycisphaerales bacterium]